MQKTSHGGFAYNLVFILRIYPVLIQKHEKSSEQAGNSDLETIRHRKRFSSGLATKFN